MDNQIAEPVELKSTHQKYLYNIKGSPAKATMIDINTPMSKVQRKLYKQDILKYIERSQGLNWDLFGVVTAVKFKDESMEVINGQHRMSLARTIDPSITEVPAHVIKLQDEKDAFRYFGLMNGGASRNVSNEEQFWALVLAEDPAELKLKAILERANLACGKVNEGNNRFSVKYTNFKKSVNMGAEEAIYAAKLIQDAGFGRWNDSLFAGLTRLLSFKNYKHYLMDQTCAEGKAFCDWFMEVPRHYQMSDLQFKKYRNVTDWSYGIAYGLMQKFLHTQRYDNQQLKTALGPIERAYKERIDDGKDEE